MQNDPQMKTDTPMKTDLQASTLIERDPWLQRLLPSFVSRCGARPVFELGCGGGRDTRVLVAAGHRVVALDASADAIAAARAFVPQAEFHCQDMRAPWPVADNELGVVVASLSLHYFDA